MASMFGARRWYFRFHSGAQIFSELVTSMFEGRCGLNVLFGIFDATLENSLWNSTNVSF